MSYGVQFAAITALIVHTAIHFRRQIWVQSRRTLREQPDIHARLMARYKQVPSWYAQTIIDRRSRFFSPFSQVVHYCLWYEGKRCCKIGKLTKLCIVTMFVFGVVCIEKWPTGLPVWGFCLSLAIAGFYIIPVSSKTQHTFLVIDHSC